MGDGVYVNMFMLFIWGIIVVGLSPLSTIISYGFCVLPVIQIGITVSSRKKIGKETEKAMFRNSTVSALLIAIGLFVGFKTNKVNRKFSYILLLGLLFAALSTIDFWVGDDRVQDLEYFRSACDAIAITLFLIAVVEFFVDEEEDEKEENCNKQTEEPPLDIIV